MTRKRTNINKSKNTSFTKSTSKYLVIFLIFFIIIIISIYAYSIQENDSISNSDHSGKWLFAMDTPEASVGSKSEYNTGFIPTLVIVDVNGIIVHREAGVHSAPQLLQYINKIQDGTADNLGTAPDFSLTMFNEKIFKLSDYQGKNIILDLMAVRCPPCHDQMPELYAVKKELGDDIVILSIDVDGAYGQETKASVIEAFGQYIME
jgi:hypothetical protein